MVDILSPLHDFADTFARDRRLMAREFAVFAHQDQKYGEAPYSAHLDAVVQIIRAQEDDPKSFEATERITAGYLHDAVEDTAVYVGLLERAFGRHVARTVDLVSDRPGRNRKERKAAAYARLRELTPADHDALIVKAADRLANVRAATVEGRKGLLKMYRKEHADFRAAAFRVGLVRPIWEELDRLLAS